MNYILILARNDFFLSVFAQISLLSPCPYNLCPMLYSIHTFSPDCFLNGPIPASFFAYCRPFLITIIQIENSVDGVLGIRTRGHMMVGADETTELWWPPICSQ